MFDGDLEYFMVLLWLVLYLTHRHSLHYPQVICAPIEGLCIGYALMDISFSLKTQNMRA